MAMVMAIIRITKNVMRCEMLMALSMAILRVGPGGLSAWQPCENSGFGVAGGARKKTLAAPDMGHYASVLRQSCVRFALDRAERWAGAGEVVALA